MKILIQSPVEHDGKLLAEGTMTTLPDEVAKALIDVKVAIEVISESKRSKADSE